MCSAPVLYSLFTHDCVVTHDSNSIIKFADDMTVVGLITKNNDTAYREEVRSLAEWCQENNISLNVNKTKELIVDYRRQKREHAPILIDGAAVVRIKSFSASTSLSPLDNVVKKAQQLLYNLRQLKKCMAPHNGAE